jgi:preprotein translocase subunit SecG
MANKKSKENTRSKSTRVLQIIFVILSLMLVLSMILAAFVTPN